MIFNIVILNRTTWLIFRYCRLCIRHVHDQTERHRGHQGYASLANHGGLHVSASGQVRRHPKGKGPETHAADASEPVGTGSDRRKQRAHRPVFGPRRASQSADERKYN